MKIKWIRFPDLSEQRLIPSPRRALQLSPSLSAHWAEHPQASSCPTLRCQDKGLNPGEFARRVPQAPS